MQIKVIAFIFILSLFNALMEQILATPVPTGSRNSSPTRRPSTPIHPSGVSSTGQQDARPVKNGQYHQSRAQVAKNDVKAAAGWTKEAARSTRESIAQGKHSDAVSSAFWTCVAGAACGVRSIGYGIHKAKAKSTPQ
ncbi:uncharacterized protein FA14DRAFT_181874 [Meira miltonrushii]|uniref:Uncharacterized protein n=1 Tax=Meira miltonrushii TaxID=1280837 RepID=A0A316V3X6_9BASI|nr:uncharacterized protein FA14DRAFT_181874 [Meira miltonrushii]PWN31954.1 hypothetical protein FA14DRAFT_181874 [Meira miltonrushii]